MTSIEDMERLHAALTAYFVRRLDNTDPNALPLRASLLHEARAFLRDNGIKGELTKIPAVRLATVHNLPFPSEPPR